VTVEVEERHLAEAFAKEMASFMDVPDDFVPNDLWMREVNRLQAQRYDHPTVKAEAYTLALREAVQQKFAKMCGGIQWLTHCDESAASIAMDDKDERFMVFIDTGQDVSPTRKRPSLLYVVGFNILTGEARIAFRRWAMETATRLWREGKNPNPFSVAA
jgi:hypothetical protein